MTMLKKLRMVSAALICCLLGACSTSQILTSKEPKQTIYSLRPAEEGAGIPTGPAKIVEIAMPTVPPGMDRDRIVLYLDNGQKLDYYAAARWSALLSNMVQDFTRRTASKTLPYVVAVTPDQEIDSQYRLQIKLNEFAPVYQSGANDTPLLRVSLEVTLTELPSDQVLSNFTLSNSMPAQENRLDVIVSGLEALLQDLEQQAFLKIDPLLTTK